MDAPHVETHKLTPPLSFRSAIELHPEVRVKLCYEINGVRPQNWIKNTRGPFQDN